MIRVRKAAERGVTGTDWLDSRHTFSFADYHDPAHMGFRTLRVINDDRIAPGGGFPTHGHRDMEILTYVVEGAVAHRDSLGHVSVIRAGELQRMSAGTGVRHSEFNASRDEPLRLLQIWILPAQPGLEPGYEQRPFSVPDRFGRLCVVASPDGRDGSLLVRQDVILFATILAAGARVEHALDVRRHAWLQMVLGSARVNGAELREGDGAAVASEAAVDIESATGSEILLFDLV